MLPLIIFEQALTCKIACVSEEKEHKGKVPLAVLNRLLQQKGEFPLPKSNEHAWQLKEGDVFERTLSPSFIHYAVAKLDRIIA